MAEQLSNEFTVNLPVDEAWAVLTDIERIAPCLPGAELHEIASAATRDDAEVYRGVVKIKLGAIAPQFKGQAQFVERDDDARRAVIRAEGRDTGGRGNANALIVAAATSLSPTSTEVTVTTELQITGRVAQFSRGIIGDVSRKLMDQFSNNLNEMLDRDAGATGEETAASSADSNPAASAVADATSASTDGEADATPGPETPRVRKIDGPATEPVDLADVAGPAVLKRLAPLLALIAVLLVVVRKRS